MTIFIGSIIGLTKLLVSIVLAVIALYVGFFIFNRIAKGVDAQAELKRGNTAMGIFIASVFIGVSVVVVSSIQGILAGLNNIFADGVLNTNDSFDIASSFLELVFGVLLAIGSIYLAVQIFTYLYRKTDIITAIENGNNAIACMVAAMIFAVSGIIHYGVLGIVTALF